MANLLNRHSSRAMGSGNMKRALLRLALEWDAVLQEAPPATEDRWVDELRQKLYDLARETALLWGTTSPVEYDPNDAVLRERTTLTAALLDKKGAT